MHDRGPRHWLPLQAALILLLTILWAPAPTANAETWESEANNCALEIPDVGSRKWKFMPDNPDWKKYGIVKGAYRRLEKLSTGEDAKGQQAFLELAVRDVGEGKDLAAIAADEDVRRFFLGRFRGKPTIDEQDTTLVEHDWPAKLLIASGEAVNGSHGKMPCYGVYLLSVARGKVYMLRMYAFHTKLDDEGLKGDLDFLSGDGFWILMPKDKSKKPPKEGPRPENVPGDEPEEEGEEEKIFLRDYKFRLIKHKKLKRVDPDPDTEEDVILKFLDSDNNGYYRILIYAFDNSRPAPTGGNYPDVDLKDWVTKDFWKYWDAGHPDGDQWTYKWPKKTRNGTFITLPELTDKNGKLFLKDGKRRPDPEDVGANEMIKKFRAAEKVKKGLMGNKKEKSMETWRANLRGPRPRVGREFEARIGFRSLNQTYRIIVSITNEGYKRWGKAIRETLESIEVARK